MDFPRQKRRTIGLDMGPLLDCVFQLLIFFLLSSTFITPTIQLKLPQADARDQPDPEEIVVSVDERGQLFVNGRPTAPERLKGELQPLLAQSSKKVVTFRGDEQMQYQHFIRVLDTARAAGAANLNIAHRPAAP